ncbi:hypothetical protein LTR17_010513 [Elasticomyces elasticus]|nr:hypothetical protein LTR17_010513 [Elasticomyces elasticus]
MATELVDMFTPIEYPVLNAEERQIRLLTFRYNDRGQISGHFKVVSLNQPVKYTALSYVWGSESPDCHIWVNLRPFLVRPGLFAYPQLAAAEKTIGHGIFIDAICINQEDTVERSIQVALMGSLYEQAFEVTVWFGEESHWLPELVDTSPAILDPAVLRSCLLREATDNLTAQDTLAITAIVRVYLLDHAYWDRVWTAQEFMLPNQLVLRLGLLKFDVASWPLGVSENESVAVEQRFA